MTEAETTTGGAPDGTSRKTAVPPGITKAKRTRHEAAAAGAGAGPDRADTTAITSSPTSAAATPKQPRQTKVALLRARLSEPGGASLASLIAATGWQAHTLRAALSGLRKGGAVLTRRREGAETIYAIEQGGTDTAGPSTASSAPDISADAREEAQSETVPAPKESSAGMIEGNPANRPAGSRA